MDSIQKQFSSFTSSSLQWIFDYFWYFGQYSRFSLRVRAQRDQERKSGSFSWIFQSLQRKTTLVSRDLICLMKKMGELFKFSLCITWTTSLAASVYHYWRQKSWDTILGFADDDAEDVELLVVNEDGSITVASTNATLLTRSGPIDDDIFQQVFPGFSQGMWWTVTFLCWDKLLRTGP